MKIKIPSAIAAQVKNTRPITPNIVREPVSIILAKAPWGVSVNDGSGVGVSIFGKGVSVND